MPNKGLKLGEKTKGQLFKIKLLSNIIYAYLHQLDIHAKKKLVNYKPENSPVIYALWHGYQWGLGIFPYEDREKLHILVSPSNDGEMIARVCSLMGYSLIRGSHQREGEKAMREIIAETKKGNNVVFMVDGPIGPKQKVKRGIIKVAKMSKVPIVPIVPYTDEKICFPSWDKYQVPYKLFNAKGTLIFGEPIFVPHDADSETETEIRLKLESYFFELEKEAIKHHKEDWEKENG